MWQVLKAPPLKSSDLHFLVTKCHCWTYDDNFGPKLKKPSFAILGHITCWTIISTSIGPRFVQKYNYLWSWRSGLQPSTRTSIRFWNFSKCVASWINPRIQLTSFTLNIKRVSGENRPGLSAPVEWQSYNTVTFEYC